MIPVPGFTVGTPYGRRGPYWSCDENSAGDGIHTGVDYPAPTGTKVVAARPGTAYHCNHGSAFGNHQVEVRCGDGTRDFYAHMSSWIGNGVKVQAGDKVGAVGAEGNVTGPHLHFERHATETGGWSCSVVRDPAPSVNYQPSGGGGGGGDDVPQYISAACNKDQKLKAGSWLPIPWDKGTDKLVHPGDPGVDVTGPYAATLTVQLDTPKGAGYTQVSWVEWDLDKKEPAETTSADSLGQVDNAVSARVGSVAKGRRLRARVRVTGDVDCTLKKATLNIITW